MNNKVNILTNIFYRLFGAESHDFLSKADTLVQMYRGWQKYREDSHTTLLVENLLPYCKILYSIPPGLVHFEMPRKSLTFETSSIIKIISMAATDHGTLKFTELGLTCQIVNFDLSKRKNLKIREITNFNHKLLYDNLDLSLFDTDLVAG